MLERAATLAIDTRAPLERVVTAILEHVQPQHDDQ